MRKTFLIRQFGAFTIACAVLACGPAFNWRDYHSADGAYRVLFPGKPSSYTRAVRLDGMTLNMTMTAAEIDNVSFAVGSAEAPDAALAGAALNAMKTALVNNIGGTVRRESTSSAASATDGAASRMSVIEIEAIGKQHGVPVLLAGRFVARNKRLYQVIVVGKEAQIARENVETFITSFKLD